jgi:hypothetical protein
VTFGLVQSFDIDGQILGLTGEEAFTLGVEWGRAWELAKLPDPFALTIHAKNADRIAGMLTEQGRRFARPPKRVGDYVEVSVSGLD